MLSALGASFDTLPTKHSLLRCVPPAPLATHSCWDRLDGAAFDDGAAPESGWGAQDDDDVACVSLISSGAATRGCTSRGGGSGSELGSRLGRNSSGGGVRRLALSQDNCLFAGGRLHIVTQIAAEGPLDRLLLVDLLLPAEVDRRRSAKADKWAVVKELRLLPEAEERTASSLRVRWQPPSQRRDEILHFKLFLTNADGRTRAVYCGPATAADIGGLQVRRARSARGGRYVTEAVWGLHIHQRRCPCLTAACKSACTHAAVGGGGAGSKGHLCRRIVLLERGLCLPHTGAWRCRQQLRLEGCSADARGHGELGARS